MPIEIRELHIRVAVNAESARPSAPTRSERGRDTASDKDALVAECVEQVLQIIHARKER
jgi:hypothetical protein